MLNLFHARPASEALLAKLKSKLEARLDRYLLDVVDLRDLPLQGGLVDREHFRLEVDRLASRTLRGAWSNQLTAEQRMCIMDDLVGERVGFGPLEPLLRDPGVSEIMVNGPSSIFVERQGQVTRAPVAFRDQDHVMAVIERFLSAAGRQVTYSQPNVDAYLADGLRVNVAVPPLSPQPILTVRKPNRALLSFVELVRLGTLTPLVMEFLCECVRGRLNILISGPSSAGKTTLMNALARLIPLNERLLLLEEYPEIFLPHHHAVRLETHPAGLGGGQEITHRELLRSALHLRPDRILLGEVRGGEALDMLQAMLVGHDGSMATVHADAPPDVIHRVTTLALLALPELSLAAATAQFMAAVQLVVHLDRFPDGSRRVTHVAEVRRDAEPGLVDLFALTPPGDPGGRLQPTGVLPAFLARLSQRGVRIPADMFSAAGTA